MDAAYWKKILGELRNFTVGYSQIDSHLIFPCWIKIEWENPNFAFRGTSPLLIESRIVETMYLFYKGQMWFKQNLERRVHTITGDQLHLTMRLHFIDVIAIINPKLGRNIPFLIKDSL